MDARTRAYGVLFAMGCLATSAAVVWGVVYSVHRDRRIPPVALVDQLGEHLTSIEQRIADEDYDTAIDQLELALKLLHQQQHLTEEMLGRAYVGRGEEERAIPHLRRALQLVPDFPEAHHVLGQAYARQGNLDRALAELREAARLDPASEPIRQNLATLERRLEREIASGSRTGEAPSTGEYAAEFATARGYLRRFYRGELDELRSAFTPGLARSVSSDGFRDMYLRVIRQLGAETAVLGESVASSGSTRTYVRRSRFERHDGDVEVVIELEGADAIDGFAFRPVDAGAGPR